MAEEPRTFKVWIALLASCEADGIAYVSPVYLEAVCKMSLPAIRRALGRLAAPDPDSRSTMNEGRRIRKVEGGYEVINYQHYRSHTYSMNADAIRQREHRAKEKSPVTSVTPRDIHGQDVTAADISDVSASASASASLHKEGERGGEDDGFSNFWAIYLRKVGKADAISAWNAIDKKDHATVTVAAINYMKSVIKLKTEIQYIKHPATFLRKDRWKDYAFEGKGALAGVTRREGCQYVPPTTADQEAEKKLRAEYDERLTAFMKERGYKTEEEIPIDIETFSEFKKRMEKGD